MDLNTIREVVRPRTRTQLPVWTAGDAWLAGGIWLFSEPQTHLKRLIDLTDLNWPALTISDDHLGIAATCTVAQLDGFACSPDWIAAPNENCKPASAGGRSTRSMPSSNVWRPRASLLRWPAL